MLTAWDELTATANRLWDSVVELAVTVLDDHPADFDLVMADDLMEHVSEFQGACDLLRQAVHNEALPRPAALAAADEAADAAVVTYWRDLCSYRPIFELRRAARQRSPEWQGWARGVEQALTRCAEYLESARAAIRAAWRTTTSVYGDTGMGLRTSELGGSR